jgi:tetratricopeptide (TPR) repeat protein
MATEAQTVSSRRSRWPLVAAAALAAVACAGLAARVALRRAAVVAAIPARPDLSAAPPVLVEELDSAERLARGYLHSADGLARLSSLYHANSFYDEAMECYRGLRALEPRNPRWPHLEANILSQFGRQDEALEREQVAVDLAPAYTAARLRLGDEMLIANRRADATRVFSRVLEREPDNPYAELGLAKVELLSGEWEKARSRLEDCVKKNPEFVGGLETLAAACEHLGRQAEAEDLKRTIGSREFVDLKDPWVDGLMDDCVDSYRLSVAAAVQAFAGNRPVAEQMLERAILYARVSSSFHRQLAVMLALDHDMQGACEHLRRAVEITPKDNDAWLLLYQYLGIMHETAAAEQALRSGLADCPDAASLHFEEARRLAAAGRNDEAIPEFRQAFQLNPGDINPLIQLAGLLFSVNRADDAIAALELALEKLPESPGAISMLCGYYVSQGDKAKALEWWAHVRRQPRTPPEVVQELRSAFQSRFGADPD